MRKILLPSSQHPDPSLQASWNYAQLGLLIFPFIPILGALGIFLALVGTWKQKYRTIIRRPLNWGFALLSVILIISAAFAFNRAEAFLGLANLFPFFLLFAAYSQLIQTPNQLRRLAWILVIPSVPVVILGFGQIFLGWATPAQLQGIVGWALEPKGNPPGRMASVFMYANILAAYLQIVFILSLGLWIEETKRQKHLTPSPSPQAQRGAGAEGGGSLVRPPHLSFSFLRDWGRRSLQELHSQPQHGNEGKKRDSYWLRWVFLSVAVIGNAIALILTNSRNAWAIVIVSCLAFALYQGWRWLIALVAGVATTVLWAAFGPSPVREWLRIIVPIYFWERLTDQRYPDRPIALLRTTQWKFAWSMTQQRPWTGWGLRNFTPLYEAKMQIWLGHPHSLLLMLTAETGIPATILFFGLVGWVMAQGILLLAKMHFTASPQNQLIIFTYLVAFGCCTLFNTVDVTLFDLRVNTLGWLLLAAICGVVYKRKALVYHLN
ncbi:O-antigen ligase family protein [Funiculus sociatus GB2-A5]|uniref:O-antigen ligase family protein n=1 Tax=Funiculus sociatus GB2-A5 TaxID=2933946 RepID=A0ABV0JS38_9CYAN|nr:O-antigen ligase family protein [Trichocoleus sp. FACHB-6]MBD1908009.1 O-antigen ligase family protein [Trichocoleus sp. FACHB-832]MBD2061564.1 O-antigen ligase family protein [Trichocoleus sp. FACHB-6]